MVRVFVAAWLCASFVGCNRSEAQKAPPKAPSSASSAPVVSAAAPLPPAPSAPAALPAGPLRYPLGAVHSPITEEMVEDWQGRWAAHPKLKPDRFMKVGDSITASGDSLYCIGQKQTLAALQAKHPEHHRTALHFGAGGKYRGSFGRDSLTAVVGWSAYNAVYGVKNPLVREHLAHQPRYALVQYGTNDIEIGALHHFADKLFDVVEQLLERGTLPLLYTVMRRADKAKQGRDVPRYNAVIRGIAQGLQIPLIDLYVAAQALPRFGLTGDGIHPSTYSGARGRDPCDFSQAGLEFGYNRRNWLSLEALTRVLGAVSGKLPAGAVAAWQGDGSSQAPFSPPELPLIDWSPAAQSLALSPCAGAGTGVSYRVQIPREGRYRLLGFDRGGKWDLHVFAEGGASCRGNDARSLVLKLEPGSYRVELRQRAEAAKRTGRQPAPPDWPPVHQGSLLVVLEEPP